MRLFFRVVREGSLAQPANNLRRFSAVRKALAGSVAVVQEIADLPRGEAALHVPGMDDRGTPFLRSPSPRSPATRGSSAQRRCRSPLLKAPLPPSERAIQVCANAILREYESVHRPLPRQKTETASA